jgi:hypothetical protein
MIAIGIAVLALGKRLAVLGAAVGAILGVALLGLLNISMAESLLLALLIPGGLAVLGFFAAGFAKGIISIVILVIGALAGAAIAMTFLDLFNFERGLLYWALALIGGVVGLVLIRRFDDWGMIILSALIGALLITRGLTLWLLPDLDSTLRTLIVLVLAGASIAYQGGIFGRRKEAAAAASTPPAKESPPPPGATK